jgi:hypothetical protein
MNRRDAEAQRNAGFGFIKAVPVTTAIPPNQAGSNTMTNSAPLRLCG